MEYLAVLRVYDNVKIELFETEDKARSWLREEISDLLRYYPYHEWWRKWAIYPTVGFLIKSENKDLP